MTANKGHGSSGRRIGELKVFSGPGTVGLTDKICSSLGIAPGQAVVDTFPDGESRIKLEDDVRGHDCFVVQSTSPPVSHNLMELLIFIDCLRRASAARITAVIPYFGYARQDRKAEGRTPITAKLVANLITEAGADRVVAMDLHADQIQGFFDIGRRPAHGSLARRRQPQDRHRLRHVAQGGHGHHRQTPHQRRPL